MRKETKYIRLDELWKRDPRSITHAEMPETEELKGALKACTELYEDALGKCERMEKALKRMPEVAYEWICDNTGQKIENLPSELQVMSEQAIADK